MNIRYKYIFIVFLPLFFLFLEACTQKNEDLRLQKIAERVSEHPQEALDSLEKIEPGSLNEADRHFYDFLTIKAKDKAYIYHTSDSLILDVIDYYSRQPKNPLYAEALYYGGRVYSDIGDYPTALNFYHKAIDNIGEDSKNEELAYRLYSQTGNLLNNLRLYDEAIQYVERALDIEKKWNDSIKVFNDLILLGGIYHRNEDYPVAKKKFQEALAWSKTLLPEYSAKARMNLAITYYREDNIDSALFYIENVKNLVKPEFKNTALAFGGKIYLEADILDSAYLYANDLIHNSDKDQKRSGYFIITSPKLRSFVSIDSLDSYFKKYRIILENGYDKNSADLALTQQASYNYKLHDEKRKLAEKSNQRLMAMVFTLIWIVLALVIVILFLKNHHKKEIISLHNALQRVKQVEQFVVKDQDKSVFINEETVSGSFSLASNKESLSDLKKKLEQHLEKLIAQNKKTNLPASFLGEEAFTKLQRKVEKEEPVLPDSPLWEALESMILKEYPKFKTNLQILLGGKISKTDLHTAIMVKLNLSTKQMAILTARTKSAIVSRRRSFSKRIFDKKLDLDYIDAIIRLL